MGVLVYLNSPKRGGETLFPFADAEGGPATPKPFHIGLGAGPTASTEFEAYCRPSHNGLKVAPTAGDAVVFFSHELPDFSIDHSAWHASCPVKDGEKWIMQRWMKVVPFRQWVESRYNVSFDTWKQLAAKADRRERAARGKQARS